MHAFTPGPPLARRGAEPGDPAVSVVLPTYRRPDVVRRAIDSVLGQTFADLELLVVDDEPSEATRAAVEEVGDARIRYLAHDRNLGLPAARNSGIRAARGRFLAFLDDDDEWLPNKLAGQLGVLDEAGPEVGVVTCFQELVDEEGRHLRVRAVRTDGDVMALLLRDDLVYAQVLLVRREVFEQVGLFVEDQHWLEDYELTLRLAVATRWATWTEPGVRMHRSEQSMSTSGLERRVDGWRLIVERHSATFGRRATARWLTKVARLHAQLGDARAWRRALLAAVRANPASGRAWGLLTVGSVAGPNAHARLARWRGRRRETAGRAT